MQLKANKFYKWFVTALLVTLAILAICSLTIRLYSEQIIISGIKHIHKQTGTEIKIDSYDFYPEALTLYGVTITQPQIIKIDKINVSLSFNPFSTQVITIPTIEIYAANAKIQIDDNKNSIIKSLIDFLSKSDTNVQVNQFLNFTPYFALKSWLENTLFIFHKPKISIKYSQSNIIATSKLTSIKIDTTDKKLEIYTDDTVINGQSIGLLKGRIQIGAKRILSIILKGRDSSQNLWELYAKGKVRKVGFNTHILLKSMPDIIKNNLLFANNLINPEKIKVDIKTKVTWPSTDNFNILGSITTSNLKLFHPTLSDTTIGPFTLDTKFSSIIDLKNNLFSILNSKVNLSSTNSGQTENKNQLTGKLILTGSFNKPTSPYGIWNGRIEIPTTQCEKILNTIPPSFIPKLNNFTLSGFYSLNASFRLDTAHLDNYFFQTNRQRFSCKVQSTPEKYSKNKLSAPFTFERQTSKDQILSFNLSPFSTNFAPISEINKSVLVAAIAAEDAGFWRHKGVDLEALGLAFKTNLKENRLAVGASTITMQTVKNLFLSTQKTLSRKVQELFLAWHLDHILKKDRILEIYLNIIEFGPNIYGISEAAHHYFGKQPSNLNLKEAAFLVSLLPNPKMRFKQYCNEKPTSNYHKLILDKLSQVHTQGRISFNQYVYAVETPLQFSRNSLELKKQCQKIGQIAKNDVGILTPQ
ncbi:MAG: transglycosylase domain-containing protein [Bdellovibrionota bacterium]